MGELPIKMKGNAHMPSDTTLIISTFERPEALRALLKSIRKFYKDLPILIADDSLEGKPVRQKNVRYYKLPFDMGLSYKRNFLVRLVETKHTVILDDDFIFTKDTKLEKLKRNLEKHELDIVAGGVITDGEVVHYEGLLEKNNGKLYFRKGNKGRKGDVVLYDLVLNFFIARTEALREYPWDNDYKIAEHAPYFLAVKDKLKVGYLEDVLVKNTKAPYEKRGILRYRDEFTNLFMHKENIREIINFGGTRKKRKPLKSLDTTPYREKPKPDIDIKREDFSVTTNGGRSLIYYKGKRVGKVIGGDQMDIERKIRHIMEGQ